MFHSVLNTLCNFVTYLKPHLFLCPPALAIKNLQGSASIYQIYSFATNLYSFLGRIQPCYETLPPSNEPRAYARARTVSLNLHWRETHGLYENSNLLAARYSTTHVQPPTHPVLIPNTKARHHPRFPGGKSSPAGTAGPSATPTDTRARARGARSAATHRPALPLLTELLLCGKAGNRLKRGNKRSSSSPGPARRPPGDAVPHQRHLPAALRRGRPAPPPSRHAPRGGTATRCHGNAWRQRAGPVPNLSPTSSLPKS